MTLMSCTCLAESVLGVACLQVAVGVRCPGLYIRWAVEFHVEYEAAVVSYSLGIEDRPSEEVDGRDEPRRR